MIQGYDEWKTFVPDDSDPEEFCDICGAPIYAGDYLTDVHGEKWCDECLNENLRRIV